MLIELTEVSGPKDEEVGKIYVNPRHVAFIEDGVKGIDAEAQSFVTEIHFLLDGKRLRVRVSPSEVRKAFNGGAR